MGRPLSFKKKTVIYSMLVDGRYSCEEISKLQSVGLKAVYQYKKWYIQPGHPFPTPAQSHLNTKLQPHMVKQLTDVANDNPGMSLLDKQNWLLQEYGVSISLATLSRRTSAKGLEQASSVAQQQQRDQDPPLVLVSLSHLPPPAAESMLDEQIPDEDLTEEQLMCLSDDGEEQESEKEAETTTAGAGSADRQQHSDSDSDTGFLDVFRTGWDSI